MNKQPIVWLLTDYRIGNFNQVLGVAETLGFPYIVKYIEYNKLSKLPNWLKCSSLLGVDKIKSASLTAPWPDILITAGRRLLPIALYIKNKNPKCFLTQLMWPGTSKDIDLLCSPLHDGITPNSHTITTIGAPNKITPSLLSTEAKLWERKFTNTKPKKIAVLIGGIKNPEAKELITQAKSLAQKTDASLLITTSRRTPEEAEKLIKNNIEAHDYLHDWKSQKENPYFALLGLSAAIITTGDSISMCAEACSTGKPVLIYLKNLELPKKFNIFFKHLFENNYATELSENAEIKKPDDILNDAEIVASEIKKRLKI